jgi:prephenate dehydrogenase
MRVHPLFQGGKIFFCEELQGSPDMTELLEELGYVTWEAIASTHDDGLDCISMLPHMEVILPAKVVVNMRKASSHQMWGFEDEDEEEVSGYSGY